MWKAHWQRLLWLWLCSKLLTINRQNLSSENALHFSRLPMMCFTWKLSFLSLSLFACLTLSIASLNIVVYRVEIDFPSLIFIVTRFTLPGIHLYSISFPIFHSQFQLASSRCPIRAFNGKQVRREWNLCFLYYFFWISCQLYWRENEHFSST